MPWFKKENEELKPEELIGMKPDVLKTRLDKVDALETAVASQNSLITEMRNSLNAIAANTRPRQEPVTPNEPTSFLEDPEVALKERMDGRINPIAGLALDTRAALELDKMSRARVKDEKGRLVSKYPFWEQYNDEIMAHVNAQPLASRVRPDIIENCYKIVVANHVNDISNDRVKGTGAFAVESGSNNGISSGRKSGEPEITENDKKQASKFGMTVEQWSKAKKDLSYVGI